MGRMFSVRREPTATKFGEVLTERQPQSQVPYMQKELWLGYMLSYEEIQWKDYLKVGFMQKVVDVTFTFTFFPGYRFYENSKSRPAQKKVQQRHCALSIALAESTAKAASLCCMQKQNSGNETRVFELKLPKYFKAPFVSLNPNENTTPSQKHSAQQKLARETSPIGETSMRLICIRRCAV